MICPYKVSVISWTAVCKLYEMVVAKTGPGLGVEVSFFSFFFWWNDDQEVDGQVDGPESFDIRIQFNNKIHNSIENNTNSEFRFCETPISAGNWRSKFRRYKFRKTKSDFKNTKTKSDLEKIWDVRLKDVRAKIFLRWDFLHFSHRVRS